MPITSNSARVYFSLLAVGVGIVIGVVSAWAKPTRKDAAPISPQWSMLTPALQRNMVNLHAKDIPALWSVEAGKQKNIKWSADVSSGFVGQPVVAHGKVYVNATNKEPRDPTIKGHRAVLMAFREADGAFLWQIAHPYPDAIAHEILHLGLLSTPAVDEHRLYYVTPACEVICADADKGTKLWRYDMMKQLGVSPCFANICSPLVVGDLVYVNTGNGRDDLGDLPAPNAPSFVALHKRTGKLVWQSNLPGKNIIEGSWSSPTCALVNGIPQVIFAGGDCVIYSFEPDTGKLLWKCDCLPTRRKLGGRETDPYFVGSPVVVGDRLYVGQGVAPESSAPPRYSHFLCLDITKKGDVSLKSYDAKDPKNKDSALVWAFGGLIAPPPARGRQAYFGPTMSTPAVHDGLVYIPELSGYLHCLDAKTGRRYWEHDFKTSVWSSPYWVDDRLYLATQDGEVCIFAPGKTGQLLTSMDMDEQMHTTPAAANGTLFLLTRSKLYAVAPR
jgi:outer membrane protein assembly factor BamB